MFFFESKIGLLNAANLSIAVFKKTTPTSPAGGQNGSISIYL